MDLQDKISSTKIPTTRLPENMPLASAYVPYQFWEEPIPPQDGLRQGTIFDELDLPFIFHGGVDIER